MGRSVLTSTVFLVHEPANTREIMLALACPLFGAVTFPEIPAAVPTPSNGDDIPALYSSTGHWNAVWRRS